MYWVTKGGADAIEYVKKYAGRIPQFHMKDMDKEDGSWAELGNGTVDLQGCRDAARDSVCSWLIYEQDACKRPQIKSAAISADYMRELLGR